MNVLVTGVKGQLGHDVVNECKKRGYHVCGVDVEEMDITDMGAVIVRFGYAKGPDERCGVTVRYRGALAAGVYEGVRMAEYIDEIEALYFKNAGFEAEKGSYKKVYRQFLLKMQIAENKNEIKDAYQTAKQEMSELKQIIPENPVRIGVVGEYFTVMDEHSNQFLQEKLVNLGASVYRFMNVTNCHFRAKETALRPKIREYVRYNMGPTTTWTVNSALDYAKRGFDGIIHVKSFGCTPEMDAIPVLQNISKDYHIPVLYLSYDMQESDTGLDTRLEAFYDMLERKKKVIR